MRRIDFVIFFSIVLSVYGVINAYIFFRGWSTIPDGSTLAPWYLLVFLFLALSFIGGRFLERVSPSMLSSMLIWLGSFWLAAIVYLLLFVVAIDMARLVHAIVPFFPDGVVRDMIRAGQMTVLCVTGATAVIVLAGYLNARTPRVKTLHLGIPKNSHAMKSLNIVMASDIHLGTIVCKSRLERIVATINRLQPDIVLLPGDVVDEDIGPVIKQNLGETLRKIRAPLGVVAVTGNHEYIGGVEPACRYLVDHGITMLRDEVLVVKNSFTIVGREDRSYNRGSARRRKSLEELMKGVDRSLPVILMDHQPFALEEAVSHSVDLQFSGHTHHGQLWPFNFITKRVYELSWGYLKKGATHIYVSCGVGTWGPPVRTGNRPEIVNIKLSFG